MSDKPTLILEIIGLILSAILAVAVLITAWNYLFGARIIRLLVNRYLRKRRIAWVSLIAVTLCTTMVIVVISVMGGWLRMFRESAHNMAGDIIVSRQSWGGFGYYQEMIDRINKLPGVQDAVPMIHTFGLVNIANQIQLGVQVTGLPLEKMDGVSKFRQSLYRQWTMADDPDADKMAEDNPDLKGIVGQKVGQENRQKPATFKPPLPDAYYKGIFPNAKVDVTKWPGMIVGVGVVGIQKDDNGHWTGRDALYQANVKLTVLGLRDESSDIDASQKTVRNYWIVDDSRTGIWMADDNNVYVPFNILQKDLQMTAGENPDQDPARATDIEIGVKPGVDIYQVKPQVQAIVNDVMSKHGYLLELDRIKVQTWEEQQADFLGAVEHEKVLVTFLFGIISIVAIFLIFCIFYMIVVEKTRDIGIIKSVGATGQHIAWIFLAYGLVIGIVGGGLGLLSGYLIVHNINELHAWLTRVFHVQIWSAKTYAFDTIPNTLNPKETAIIVAVAVVSSLLGAFVPAVRAARMQPVESLRWE